MAQPSPACGVLTIKSEPPESLSPISAVSSSEQNVTSSNEITSLSISGIPYVREMVKSPMSAPASPARHASFSAHQTSFSASASPLSSAISGFVKPLPKSQEDPDTLKRIQQILDDYNEQIRNSPDLQNRPAPRRRTTVQLNPSAPMQQVMSPPGQKKQITKTGKEAEVDSQLGQNSTVKVLAEYGNGDSKSTVRQIMVPSGLADSLAASGRQLMVVTCPGGRKMVVLRPLSVGVQSDVVPEDPESSSTSTISPDVALRSESTDPPTTSSSPRSSPSPGFQAGSMSSPLQTVNLSIAADEPIAADESRPTTPGFGIPMEMTPGQIMEAEMSAGNLLDDDDDSGLNGLSAFSSTNNRHFPCPSSSSISPFVCRADEGEAPDSLPDDFFAADSSPPTSKVTELNPSLLLPSSKPPMFFDDDYDLFERSSSKSSPETVTSDEHSDSTTASSCLTSTKRKHGSNFSSQQVLTSKRTRKPSVKVVEAAEAVLRNRKSTSTGHFRKLDLTKLQRGSVGSESHCSTSSESDSSSVGFIGGSSLMIENK